jgi:hypothetical protein
VCTGAALRKAKVYEESKGCSWSEDDERGSVELHIRPCGASGSLSALTLRLGNGIYLTGDGSWIVNGIHVDG